MTVIARLLCSFWWHLDQASSGPASSVLLCCLKSPAPGHRGDRTEGGPESRRMDLMLASLVKFRAQSICFNSPIFLTVKVAKKAYLTLRDPSGSDLSLMCMMLWKDATDSSCEQTAFLLLTADAQSSNWKHCWLQPFTLTLSACVFYCLRCITDVYNWEEGHIPSKVMVLL